MTAAIATVGPRGPAPELERGVLALWERHGGPAADAGLGDVVCVALASDGNVVGAATAVAGEAPLVRRELWIYDAVLAPAAEPGTDRALLSAAFAALAARFAGSGPIGLCLQLSDPEEMARRPEMQWQDPPLTYVGYLYDGRQVRVGYFPDARIGPGVDDG